jgi:small subunit ribosomal protein S6
MTLPAPTYDLVLLLDPQAEEQARTKIVTDARAAIEGRGELLRHDEWGERALTYPIERRASAHYQLLQFHVSDTQLLADMDRTLRIADEVLRFRIVKLAPRVPAPPDMTDVAARRSERDGEARPDARAPAPAPEPPAAEPAEASAEAAVGESA